MKWGDCRSKDDLVTEPLSHSLNFRVLPRRQTAGVLTRSPSCLPGGPTPSSCLLFAVRFWHVVATPFSVLRNPRQSPKPLRDPRICPSPSGLPALAGRVVSRVPAGALSSSALRPREPLFTLFHAAPRRSKQRSQTQPSRDVEPASFLPLRAQHRPRRRPLPWRRPSCIPGRWKSLFLSFCKPTFGPPRFQTSPPRGSQWSRAAGRQGATNCKLFGGGLGAGCRERCVVQQRAVGGWRGGGARDVGCEMRAGGLRHPREPPAQSS